MRLFGLNYYIPLCAHLRIRNDLRLIGVDDIVKKSGTEVCGVAREQIYADCGHCESRFEHNGREATQYQNGRLDKQS